MPIAYNATAAQVQAALTAIPGMAGNVVVYGSSPTYIITFLGTFSGLAIPNLIGNPGSLTGTSTGLLIATAVQGSTALGDPIMITSVPNTATAVDVTMQSPA